MLIGILKKYWREIIIGILLIVVVLSTKQCQKQKSDIALLNNIQDSTFNVIREIKGKNGELTSQVNTYEITIDQLKESGDKLGIDNKALKQQIGSLKNLTAYYKAKIELRDTFTIVNHDTTFIEKGDTTRAKAFQWSNKYLVIQGFTAPSYTTISYDYHPTFTLTSYYKDKGFLRLKKGQLVSDLKFDDPNMQVREFKAVRITEEPKKWYETKLFYFLTGAAAGRVAEGIIK